MPKIVVTQPTKIKRYPKQSSSLSPQDFLAVEPGKEFLFTDYAPAPNNHVKFYLAPNGWGDIAYCYLPHIEGVTIKGNRPDNQPKDKPTTNPELRKRVRSHVVTNVPGVSRLDMYDPVHAEDAPNIYWYELLHFNGSTFRRPESVGITHNLVNLAKELQKIRNRYNRPMTINSGYRDSVTNRRVGGARNSEHVVGGSADFVIQGVHPRAVFNDLDPTWNKPLASSSVFTHVGVTRKWRARWSYGF